METAKRLRRQALIALANGEVKQAARLMGDSISAERLWLHQAQIKLAEAVNSLPDENSEDKILVRNGHAFKAEPIAI